MASAELPTVGSTSQANTTYQASLAFDRAGFDRSLDFSMEFDLDSAYLGKAHAIIMGQGIPTLRIGEAIRTVPALKRGYPGASPFFQRRKNASNAFCTRLSTSCSTWHGYPDTLLCRALISGS